MTPKQFLLAAARNDAASHLTVRQIAMLLALSDGRQWGTKELARHLGVRTPTITRCCIRLGAEGYLINAPDKVDKRLRQIGITAAGKALLSFASVESGRAA